MRILGIDPGLRLTGYGCVERAAPASGSARHRAPERVGLVEAGVIRLDPRAPVPDRLAELDHDFRALLDRLRPAAVAVEMLFAHYKHPATAIVMGHARGVLLLAIRRAGLELVELRPTEVKKSLTGHGHAGKEQMQRAVRDVFGLPTIPKPPDVADALAVGLCALTRHGR
ncbi:MAG: crossover junction endodeoxyribonuclease RuvC [Phycisphaerae bacterium]|nr:crossover junction endodeoxyribonuclease RuvC [Phycisphaerae bacterium]